jgi:hypothetical protein
MPRGRLWVLGFLMLWMCAETTLTAESSSGQTLLGLLPGPEALQGWAPAGSPQTAEGQDLFALIDGGAELFLRFGFERAVVQEYADGKGGAISLEIYRMQEQAGARDVYAQRVGQGAAPLQIGAAGVQGDYYLIFRQDCHFVTVTALDQAATTRQALLPLARAVEASLAASTR